MASASLHRDTCPGKAEALDSVAILLRYRSRMGQELVGPFSGYEHIKVKHWWKGRFGDSCHYQRRLNESKHLTRVSMGYLIRG